MPLSNTLRQAVNLNPLSWISVNRRLMNILSFAIAMFAAMLVAVHFFPGPSPYKLLADKDLLQLPLLILPLMMAWMLYRKLWLAGLAFSLLYLVTLAWYDIAMPPALEAGLAAVKNNKSVLTRHTVIRTNGIDDRRASSPPSAASC